MRTVSKTQDVGILWVADHYLSHWRKAGAVVQAEHLMALLAQPPAAGLVQDT